MKPSIHCRVAYTKQDLDDALRIRWEVFGQEKGYLTEEAPRVSRDMDPMDTLGSTLHIVAYLGDEPAGTARLVLMNPAVADENALRFGFGLELKLDLTPFDTPGVMLAEATRVCVLDRFRMSGVFDAVYATLVGESLARGVTHLVAAANAETDAPLDAGIMHRVALRKGLVSSRWAVSPRGPSRGPAAPSRWFYSNAERARAAAGDLTKLRLPLTLLLYARKGARFIGAPVYDDRFHMFSMPLVLELTAAQRISPEWRRAA